MKLQLKNFFAVLGGKKKHHRENVLYIFWLVDIGRQKWHLASLDHRPATLKVWGQETLLKVEDCRVLHTPNPTPENWAGAGSMDVDAGGQGLK